MGEVGVYGHHGDIAVGEGPFVACLRRVVADEFPGEPPVGAPLWVDAFLEAIVPQGFGLVTDAYAVDFGCWQTWDVDIERDIGGESVFQGCSDDLAYPRQAGREVGIGTVVEQREAYGVEPQSCGFDDGTHGATVEHIDGTVTAMVDAGEHEVGSSGAEIFDSEFDAVDGGTVAAVDAQSRSLLYSFPPDLESPPAPASPPPEEGSPSG